MQDHPCLARPQPVTTHVTDDSDESVSDDSGLGECDAVSGEFDAGAVIQKYRDEFNVLLTEYELSELTIFGALDYANGDPRNTRQELDRIARDREYARWGNMRQT